MNIASRKFLKRKSQLVLSASLLGAGFVMTPLNLSAGAFIFAGEDNGVDVITHPAGYSGVGGVIYVEVCIAPDAVDGRLAVQPVLNIMKEFNEFEASSPNLVFGSSNDIPGGQLDFESLTLHEIGHCVGLAHPNAATESGLSGSDRNYTKSAEGTNEDWDIDAGDDGIIGSADDVRGDDINLHWFEVGVNNPFLAVAQPDGAIYSRDLADLPVDDTFAVNADRTVANSLGFPNTEAVMQQGQFSDEDQRNLTTDDIATLRMGMTGVDEIAGNADDYEIRMVYGGVRDDTSDCEIVIDSDPGAGLAFCSTGGFFVGPQHVTLSGPDYFYNPDVNFYFNQLEKVGCSAADNDLDFSSITHTNTLFHEACDSVSYGDGYTVGAAGNVTAIAPSVSLGPGTRIDGRFRTLAVTP